MLPFLRLFIFFYFLCFTAASAQDFAAAGPFEKNADPLCHPLLRLPESQKKLEDAEVFFSAAFYEKAIPLYNDLLLGPEKNGEGTLAFLYFRIGQGHYYLKQFEKSLEYFENPALAHHCTEAYFFAGLALSQLGRYPSAISKFEKYINFSNNKMSAQAHFELGLAFYRLKQWDSASKQFASVPFQENRSRLFLLSRFYLARTALQQGNYLKAEASLNEAAPFLEDAGMLQSEWAYLNGELYFYWKDYQRAVEWYGSALPEKSMHKASWSQETLSKLGTACLRAAEDVSGSPHKLAQYLEKAENVFNTLASISSDEKAYIALAQCHLAKARFLNSAEAYAHAEEILSKPRRFLSKENQSQVLLLRAQAGATYSQRDHLYRLLTHDLNHENSTYNKGLLLRGLNDFEEAQVQLKDRRMAEASKLFERAIYTLNQAFRLLSGKDPKNAALALKYQAYAFTLLETPKDQLAAFHLFTYLIKTPSLLNLLPDPDEIFYLKGLTASHLALLEGGGDEYKIEAQKALKQGIAAYPQGKFTDQVLFLLGTLSYKTQEYSEAAETFAALYSRDSNSTLKGDALFWKARALEKTDFPPNEIQKIKREVFEKYPSSAFAPEAYFTLYSYRDYLHGERQAIKHLHAFPGMFPNSPYLLNAYYLIGLDFKKDRKTPEGKWISKRNLNSAIDAFQQCETAFDRLNKDSYLQQENMAYYIAVRTRATLERALTNIAIAEESQGAKRQIYLEYAEDVLREMESDQKDGSLAKLILNERSNSSCHEESAYWLGETCLRQGKQKEAVRIFNQMLEKYQGARITKGYFLSKVCYNLGLAAFDTKEYSEALKFFLQAEDAAKGKILSTDEKLDLWIQQSLCYQKLKQLDEAILILSKAVNDDAISSVRIKAMYLRADAYALQGRLELARKQLEAASKQGGEWGLKAKQKLDQEYGYQ